MATLNEEFEALLSFANMVKRSKAASVAKLPAATITEMINGVLVSRPLEKVEYFNETEGTKIDSYQPSVTTTTSKEPEIIELAGEPTTPTTPTSKGGSISHSGSGLGLGNKVQLINDFMLFGR